MTGRNSRMVVAVKVRRGYPDINKQVQSEERYVAQGTRLIYQSRIIVVIRSATLASHLLARLI